jgi:hypothetical protein
MNRMRTRFILVIGILVLAGAFGRADAPATSHADSFSKQGLFKADVNDLKDTQLVVSPDVPLAPDKNVLWCGTLQLAWNEAEALVGEKLRFTKPAAAADLLDAGSFTRTDLAPDSYVAIADFERNDVEDEIRAALERTFHGAASPELIPPKPANPGPDDFVAYAYLYKNLAFAHPFTEDTLQFENKPVETFGFDTGASVEIRSQTHIYDYQSPDDFIVSLQTKSPQDQLILAKIEPATTLQATIKTVLDRMAAQSPETARFDDYLHVPELNFDLRRSFHELEGLVLDPTPTAKIKDKLIVKQVEQLVRFQLNQNGAILKSEAAMSVVAAAISAPLHALVFDKPFLILLKQRDSPRPYFALWVGNPTLLVPAKSEE